MPAYWTPRRHAMAWLSLAGLALAYLACLWYFPSLARPQSERRAAVAAPLTSDATPAASIEKLSGYIQGLRDQIKKVSERNAALGQRMKALENALGPATSALPPDDPPTTGALTRKARLASPVPKVTVTYSALPEDGFGDTRLNRSPLPIAGLREPTRTLFGVELATAASLGDLKRQWNELTSRHKPLLGALEARQHKPEATGAASLKLIAGPFANAADAARLCARLRAAGTACEETIFSGEALPPD